MIKLIDVLREAKQVGTLIHSTSYKSAISIMKDGFVLKSGAVQSTNYDNLKYISFTRDLEGWHGGSGVNFIVNGDKLSEKYKIAPYEYNPDDEIYEGNSSEQEERIDASKYKGQVSIADSLESIIIIKPSGQYERGIKDYEELMEYIADNQIDKRFKVITTDKKVNLSMLKRKTSS